MKSKIRTGTCRLKAFILLRHGKVIYQSQLAHKLGFIEKTVREWLKTYNKYGLSDLITIKVGCNNTRVISDEAIDFIESQLTNPQTTVTSYVELQGLIGLILVRPLIMGRFMHIVGVIINPSLKYQGSPIIKKTQKPKRFLKNLKKSFELFRLKLNNNKYTSVNLYFQDESRFGLITKLKKVITAKGIKRIGKYRHSYQSKWLWGSISPITGESFCMFTDTVCKELFIKYLTDFSAHNPSELKIIIIDNAAFYSTKKCRIT